MYLTGDAKLWWCTGLSDDASANCDRILNVGRFEERIEGLVLPLKYILDCKGVLLKVEAFGHWRDYVKEFSSLMLDIRDMSEEDKLFNFLLGTTNLGLDGTKTSGRQGLAVCDCCR
ncbi:UNVERIFIED_CONTAM: hypothetical protein Sradi_6989500 [Sesamum radiatum]|uniref:Uncharacterized protein n=1 Tax=Sesamum radiatum TaxID=300843 RepID=A0AAW2JCH5_SESRA